jgi:hypothetical protein
MPHLNWSATALAAIKNKDQRAERVRLFRAYFRVAEEQALIGTRLPLDLPASKDEHRYHFYAKFTPNVGWTIEAELKRERREVRFERRLPPISCRKVF